MQKGTSAPRGMLTEEEGSAGGQGRLPGGEVAQVAADLPGPVPRREAHVVAEVGALHDTTDGMVAVGQRFPHVQAEVQLGKGLLLKRHA